MFTLQWNQTKKAQFKIFDNQVQVSMWHKKRVRYHFSVAGIQKFYLSSYLGISFDFQHNNECLAIPDSSIASRIISKSLVRKAPVWCVLYAQCRYGGESPRAIRAHFTVVPTRWELARAYVRFSRFLYTFPLVFRRI